MIVQSSLLPAQELPQVARALPSSQAVRLLNSVRREKDDKRQQLSSQSNVPRIVGADSGDLDEIFSKFLDPVYRFIYRQVGNQEDAEDLTSEVFLSASRKLDVTRAENAIGSWLFTVSRRVIADHWRRYYKMGPRVDIDELQLAEIKPSTTTDEGREAKSRFIRRVLDRLPERHRLVLELRFLRGYSLEETANEIGITIENVKITQHRALAKAAGIAEEPS